MNNKIALDVNKVKPIIKDLNLLINETQEIIEDFINEYNKLDEKIWKSDEKIKLDNILNNYFMRVKKYGNNTTTTVNSLENYVNTYAEVHDVMSSSVGGNDVQ